MASIKYLNTSLSIEWIIHLINIVFLDILQKTKINVWNALFIKPEFRLLSPNYKATHNVTPHICENFLVQIMPQKNKRDFKPSEMLKYIKQYASFDDALVRSSPQRHFRSLKIRTETTEQLWSYFDPVVNYFWRNNISSSTIGSTQFLDSSWR